MRGPKCIKNIVGCGLGLGGFFALGGIVLIGFAIGGKSIRADPLVFVLAGIILLDGILGLSSGILVWRRSRRGIPFAWSFAILTGLWGLAVVLAVLRTGNIQGGIPAVGCFICAGSVISGLMDPELPGELR